jgi:hypothetical protein
MVSRKYQQIINNKDTFMIGFLSRLINFLEDIIDDSECEDVYVWFNMDDPLSDNIFVEGVNCLYNIEESINVFSHNYDLVVERGRGEYSLNDLYSIVIERYKNRLHYIMKDLAGKSIITHREYYLGILFNGKAFLIEGERDKVLVPGNIPQCFSAHTHPSQIPIPSRADLKTINKLFIDRGIGHAIETVGTSMIIYRVSPITLSDLEIIKDAEKMRNPVKALSMLTSTQHIKIMYI